MVNYACAFSQSELGKYFKWIINIFIPCSLFPNSIFISPDYSHFWISVSGLVIGCGQNQDKTNLTEEILEISRSWTSVLMAATCGNRPKQNSVINNAQKDYKHRKILYLFETFSMIQLKCLVIPAGEEWSGFFPVHFSSFERFHVVVL